MVRFLTVGWIGLVILGAASAAPAQFHRYGASCWRTGPGTEGDWLDAVNWDYGVPTAQLTAYFANNGAAHLGGGTAVCQYLDLECGTVSQSGGTLTVSARYGPGSIHLGWMSALWDLPVSAAGATYPSTYTLSGGQLNAGSLMIGDVGFGRFDQSGGVCALSRGLGIGGDRGRADMGRDPIVPVGAPRSEYVLSGGQLLSTGVTVGAYGHGRFVQSGGEHEVTGTVRVGRWLPVLSTSRGLARHL